MEKIKESEVSASPGDIYQPSLWYFKLLFLKDQKLGDSKLRFPKCAIIFITVFV